VLHEGYLHQLEYGDKVGFDAVVVNEHHNTNDSMMLKAETSVGVIDFNVGAMSHVIATSAILSTRRGQAMSHLGQSRTCLVRLARSALRQSRTSSLSLRTGPSRIPSLAKGASHRVLLAGDEQMPASRPAR
jgi:hypothetical protein